MNEQESLEGNLLFPVFFRLDKLQLLIVGGGTVGLEKAEAIFKNSANAKVTLVAPEIREELLQLAKKHSNLNLVVKSYEISDLENKDLIIAATNIKSLNAQVYEDAKRMRIICNVADTPESCDFYMCSVVKKGDLKIAISTNGKSPTFAKRIREMFEEILPEGINEVLDNLTKIREKLKGDFEYKVKKLDEITSAIRKERDTLL